MTITKSYSPKEIEQLYNSLSNKQIKKTPPYAHYQIKMSDCVITAYESGKVVFQGEGASFYSEIIHGTTVEKKKSSTASTKEVFPQAGSDEVGTGDYFGPVVVCATYVDETILPFLKTLNIQDSKQVKDEDILRIAPQLMEKLTYSSLVLENKKYNEVHQQHNMNAIKALLHNQAFINLQKKLNHEVSTIYVDQFTPPTSYFRYLKNENTIIKNIHFETKAEDKFISVACASIIARYLFLDAMDKMSKHYDFEFPKGAGKHVDLLGEQLVEQHGEAILKHVAKVHFKNTERILNID